MRDALKWHAQPVFPEDIAAEISRLSGLPLRELKAAWQAKFRRPPPKGLWRDLLLRTLAWRIQERQNKQAVSLLVMRNGVSSYLGLKLQA